MHRVYIVLFLYIVISIITVNSCQNGRIRKADSYINNEEFRKAEEVLKKEIAMHSNNVKAYYLLGAKVYAPTGEYSKMNAVFDSALAINENYTEDIQTIKQKYFAREMDTGEKLFKQVLQDSIIQKSIIDSAIYHYENAVTIKLDTIAPHIQLARGYQQLGEYTRAHSIFQDATDSNPNNFKVLYFYGKFLNERQQFDDAAEYLERAYELDPSSPEAINALLNAYENSGNIEKARSALEKAVTNFPHNSALHFRLAEYYNQLSKNAESEEQKKSMLNSAVRFQEKALKISSHDLQEKIQLGSLYEDMGRWHKAISTYEELLQKDPNNKELIRRLANAAYRSGDPVRAKEALQKLKKLH